MARNAVPYPGRIVRTARCSDGIVTLDVMADRYLSHYSRPAQEATRSASDLDDSGGCPIAPPWREAPSTATRLSLADIGIFARAVVSGGLSFRRLSFSALLEDARRRQDNPTLRRDAVALARAATVFERLCRWLPAQPLCLARSYILLRFLAAQGLRANWIFGVGLFPFSAHCWVASGTEVLGERADLLQRFSVILTVDRAYL